MGFIEHRIGVSFKGKFVIFFDNFCSDRDVVRRTLKGSHADIA
jgi:hypothetical protein